VINKKQENKFSRANHLFCISFGLPGKFPTFGVRKTEINLLYDTKALTIRKLTYKNPTMKAKFDEARKENGISD
jgi:hypothetical protein